MALAQHYRGRLAPSPTGLLHAGHARTFWVAALRAQQNGGTLILRNEDLDPERSRPEFVTAMMEDLRWLVFGGAKVQTAAGRTNLTRRANGGSSMSKPGAA